MQLTKIEEKFCKTQLGNKIQKLMELHAAGFSKVAQATGLTAETIRQIVNGSVKNPGIETLAKIAQAFSINLFQLLETNDVTPLISKKKVKIIDLLSLEKKLLSKKFNKILEETEETTELLYIDDESLAHDYFAIAVNQPLAEKLSYCGMPLLKKNDFLIFKTTYECEINAIILARKNIDILVLGIIIDIDQINDIITLKSVDIPQKQIITTIKSRELIGVIRNVQFS